MMHRTQLERDRRYRASPKGQFAKHRQNAYSRGLDFLLTFDQWYDIWLKSGHWKKRGNRKGRYCMCRRGDEGPYAQGNVYIGTWSANTAERNRTVVSKALKISKTVTGATEAPF